MLSTSGTAPMGVVAKTARQIRPLDLRLLPAASNVLGRAFSEDPIVRVILPAVSIEDRIYRLTAVFGATLSADLQRSHPLCVMDKGRPVGVALVHPPGTPALPHAAQLRIIIRTVTKAGPYGLGRWSIWMRRIKPYRPQEPHYYLEQLGVEPRIQGQGVGSALMQALTKQADREKRACFLETANHRNLPLYDRFGFQVVAERAILGVQTWFLRRPPRNA